MRDGGRGFASHPGWDGRGGQKNDGEHYRRAEACEPESDCPNYAPAKNKKTSKACTLSFARSARTSGFAVVAHYVPVKQLSKFNSHMCRHTRDMGCSNSRVRKLCNHWVLQAHDKAKKHHGCRDKEPFMSGQVAAANEAKTKQQHGLDHERKGVFALECLCLLPAPIYQDGGNGRTSDE